MGGVDLFHERYGALLFDTLHAPSPYCYRCPLGLEPETCGTACAGEAERLIEEHSDELAAVILVPAVQGAAGMIVQPPGYLERVSAAAKRAGAPSGTSPRCWRQRYPARLSWYRNGR